MADNWVLISVIDSYHQYRKADAPNAIIVPDYDGRALSIGIIRDLEKRQACLFGDRLFFT